MAPAIRPRSIGDLIVISSLDMIRTIASEAGLTLCSVH